MGPQHMGRMLTVLIESFRRFGLHLGTWEGRRRKTRSPFDVPEPFDLASQVGSEMDAQIRSFWLFNRVVRSSPIGSVPHHHLAFRKCETLPANSTPATISCNSPSHARKTLCRTRVRVSRPPKLQDMTRRESCGRASRQPAAIFVIPESRPKNAATARAARAVYSNCHLGHCHCRNCRRVTEYCLELATSRGIFTRVTHEQRG
jgi:hypothetical protein